MRFSRFPSAVPRLVMAAMVSLAAFAASAGAAAPPPPPPSPQEALARLRSGPMLGYAEIQETAVWLQTRVPARVQLRYWPVDRPQEARVSDEVRTSAEGDLIARFVLPGLAFGTRYDYEVFLDGTRLPIPYRTQFATQPMWRWRTDPPAIRFAIGSCAYVNEERFDRPGTPYGSDYGIFSTLAAQQPEFMLWMGDDVYYREADWTTESGMRARWAHSRSLPELQPLLASTAQYAIWDDHDFGPDNSDRTFAGRERSLRVFEDYWLNPGAGLPEAPGVFFSFQWGDVDVFMTDGRYYRAPDELPVGPDKRMLGRAQLDWLEESLVSSTAPFKFVVMGSQVLNPNAPERPSDAGRHKVEGLRNFPADLDELLDFLRTRKVEGVVFLSGDIHQAQLMKMQPEGLYPLYEFTSSSLTAGLSALDEENPARVPGTLVKDAHNFGIVEVTGPRGERVLTLRAFDLAGVERWRHSIAQRELTFASLAPEAPATPLEQEDLEEPAPPAEAAPAVKPPAR